MKNLTILLATVISLFSFTTSLMAGAADYSCVVSHEVHLSEDGSLKPFPRSLEIGKRFSVSRVSGVLTEATVSFWSPRDAKVTVLASGNSQNSYVVSYVAPSAGSGVHFTHLNIEEYTKGSKKPFLLSSGSGVYSGICE